MKFIAIKVGKANVSRDPNKTGTVLLDAINNFRRQPILNIKMDELFITDLTMQKVAVRKKRKKKNTPE